MDRMRTEKGTKTRTTQKKKQGKTEKVNKKEQEEKQKKGTGREQEEDWSQRAQHSRVSLWVRAGLWCQDGPSVRVRSSVSLRFLKLDEFCACIKFLSISVCPSFSHIRTLPCVCPFSLCDTLKSSTMIPGLLVSVDLIPSDSEASW